MPKNQSNQPTFLKASSFTSCLVLHLFCGYITYDTLNCSIINYFLRFILFQFSIMFVELPQEQKYTLIHEKRKKIKQHFFLKISYTDINKNVEFQYFEESWPRERWDEEIMMRLQARLRYDYRKKNYYGCWDFSQKLFWIEVNMKWS